MFDQPEFKKASELFIARRNREVKEKVERRNAIINRFVNEGCQAQREFALSPRSCHFNENEARRVYYAIIAIAIRDHLSLQSKSSIENVTARFLDCCNWSGMSDTRIGLSRSWTNAFIARGISFDQPYIDTFLAFVDHMSCSAENYASLSGSNGCADQLANWDGTQKRGIGTAPSEQSHHIPKKRK